ncbi:Hypothetical_protein [Hexamita inflata]|uniref:Hypothetical_protein n=1 Tax=Hexamita inflata TaxID=28002 RepID=A0AA86U665_9EUKA|nr:Hypothetical protein HINF_LOCUS3569 [Hexamita inflata]CAI9930890.1 Hypothetical protein HINF_LOCUS18535 [Hexamita inflata]CAI9940856.1 Hypothetical protein HINF_LOCUS28501 [Hexamita inflata]
MFSQIDTLVPELAAALGIPPERTQINSVIYSALMLPDQSYCQMIGQISRNMNVDDSTISHMFQYLVDRTLNTQYSRRGIDFGQNDDIAITKLVLMYTNYLQSASE